MLRPQKFKLTKIYAFHSTDVIWKTVSQSSTTTEIHVSNIYMSYYEKYMYELVYKFISIWVCVALIFKKKSIFFSYLLAVKSGILSTCWQFINKRNLLNAAWRLYWSCQVVFYAFNVTIIDEAWDGDEIKRVVRLKRVLILF